MPSPLPGMDPYLEDPSFWPDFHRRLLAILAEQLQPGLGDRYTAVVGQRRYATQVEEYLEIRQKPDDSLVTLLEVLNPANKSTEAGRQAYLDHRRQAQERVANTVEIDLLLQGRTPLSYSREGLPDWDFAVTVTRQTQPERYEIYTATLQKRLPKFRLPLAANDRDTVLDLQAAFSRCYEQGGYAERIDYGQEPSVPLSDEARDVVDSLLVAGGLRKPMPPHDEIAVVAYQLWEREGRPPGRDKEHWQQALKQLRQVPAQP